MKYVIISHGHRDHVGGARLIQDRLKPRLVIGAPDWEVDELQNTYPQGKPVRDIVATDGQKITLGDGSVTLVHTPGHTPGTISMIFEVKDGGKPLTVAYSGGTAFNFVNAVPAFDTYIASQRKMAALPRQRQRDRADDEPLGIRQRGDQDQAHGRRANRANRIPIRYGREAVARYFKVTDECAQVARLKLIQAGRK